MSEDDDIHPVVRLLAQRQNAQMYQNMAQLGSYLQSNAATLGNTAPNDGMLGTIKKKLGL